MQQCSTWSALSFTQDELSRYLATCAVFIASRCDNADQTTKTSSLTTLSVNTADGITIDQIVSEANVRLVDFFEILTSCITTLLMEGSEFHRSVNRAEKKLISSSILFDEYVTLYDKMFHIPSGNVLDDIGAKMGWTLFILLKESIGRMVVDFELLSHLMASVMSFLYRESPDKILNFQVEEEILLALGTHTNDIEKRIVDMPEKLMMEIFDSKDLGDVFADKNAALNRLNEEYLKHSQQFEALNFDERIFLSHSGGLDASIGNVSNLKSAPIYQTNTLKRQTTQLAEPTQFFKSPIRSSRVDTLITPVMSTMLSIQWVKSRLTGEPLIPSSSLFQYFPVGDNNDKVQESIVTTVDNWMKDVLLRLPFPEGLSEDAKEVRRNLIKKIFYQVLQRMLRSEEQRLGTKDFSSLLRNNKFNKSLLACSIETIYFAYNQRDILDIQGIITLLDLSAYDLSKVIESFVMHSSTLSRIMMRHFRAVEERILDSMVWQEGSVLFEVLRTQQEHQNAALSMPTNIAHGSTTPISKKLGTMSIFQSPSRDSVGERSSDNTTSTNPRPASIDFFFRKIYRLVAIRIQELFNYFTDIDEPTVKMDRVWSIVCHVLSEEYELLRNRHVDHVIMCSMYAICSKVYELQISFKNIISSYKSICETSRMLAPTDVGKILMQIPLNDGNLGDIVRFYNRAFIPATKDQILNHDTVISMPVMPDIRSPPRRRVSATSNVFISPRRPPSVGTPNRTGEGIPMSPSTTGLLLDNNIEIGPMVAPLTPRTKALFSFGNAHAARIDHVVVMSPPSTSAAMSTMSARHGQQKRKNSKVKRTLFDQTSSDEDEANDSNTPSKRMRRSIGSASKKLMLDRRPRKDNDDSSNGGATKEE